MLGAAGPKKSAVAKLTATSRQNYLRMMGAEVKNVYVVC